MPMKYAFMSFSTPELTLDEMLSLAKKLGYAGIEPRVESKHRHGVELSADAAARRTIREKAAASGVEICCVATSCKYADPENNCKHTEDTLKYIDLAADVGCSRLRVFGGSFPENVSREQASDNLITCLRSIGDHGRARGVCVCLETHDSWTSPDDVSRVMAAVNHPNVAVNWDVWHPVRQSGFTIGDAFARLRPWIRHVHFHDGTVRRDKLEQRTVGQGELDLKAVVRLLRGVSYDAFVSGEWINWEPHETHLPRELAAMQCYELELR